MNERPIPFNGPMVCAILDGRKTQTRRPIKPQLAMRVVGAEPDCPYGVPGDRLWVQEKWAISQDEPRLCYQADGGKGIVLPTNHAYCAARDRPSWFNWRSSTYMPRWACRITLEITDVRFERVQDISDEDAEAEGVDTTNASIHGYLRERFRRLWCSIYDQRGFGWDVNPWVWVVTFKKADR